MRRSIFLFLVGISLAFGLEARSLAQQSGQSLASEGSRQEIPLAEDPHTWLSYLDSIELDLDQRDKLDRRQAADIAARVFRINEQALALESQTARRLLPLQREIDSLGPSPEAGQQPETESDALLRQNLAERISEFESRRRLLRLVVARSENIQKLLIEYETSRLRQQLLVRTPSLFKAQTWILAGKTFTESVLMIAASPAVWWRQFEPDDAGRIVSVLLMIVMFGALLYSVRRRLLSWIAARKKADEPSHSDKMIVAMSVTAANVVLPVAFFGFVAFMIRTLSASDTLFMFATYIGCLMAIAYITATGLAKTFLQPNSGEWRLLAVDDDSAIKISNRIGHLILVVSFAFWFIFLVEPAGVETPEFGAVFTLFSDIAVVVLAVRILPYRFIPADSKNPHTVIKFISLILGLVLFAVPLLDLASYSRLASYLLLYLIISVIAVSMALFIRAAVVQLVNWAVSPERRAVRMVGPAAKSRDLEFLRFVLTLTADILIFLPVVWLLLILYGIPSAQLLVWLNYFINGFAIGNVRIAPFDLILGIIAFAVVLLITNLIRRAVARQLTDRLQIDVGVRNAILSAIQYVGIVIAVILAIATIGLDLTNLALVASALSVGIGFGLRTIVENFVAGLLLLIERPIKEGDWIVTGGRDGTVKKISVRSTEVETFDRSTIIVPNSELIGQPVENWSHRNRMSRVVIPIGVAYGSDTTKVREILLDCIKEDPNILQYPQPQVLFLAFGDSSLDFQIRYFLPDTNLRMPSISDMHYAIDAAFREAGIEIPFPQRDVHLKSTDPMTPDNLTDNQSADPQ